MTELARLEQASGHGRPTPKVERPFKLTICVNQTCSMDCKLCYADCGASKRPELTTEQWKRFIDELVAGGRGPPCKKRRWTRRARRRA